jgi:hypothetical protein
MIGATPFFVTFTLGHNVYYNDFLMGGLQEVFQNNLYRVGLKWDIGHVLK